MAAVAAAAAVKLSALRALRAQQQEELRTRAGVKRAGAVHSAGTQQQGERLARVAGVQWHSGCLVALPSWGNVPVDCDPQFGMDVVFGHGLVLSVPEHKTQEYAVPVSSISHREK